tara:strand:- start:147 stop:272 length:126 start_codon:yes stop_codon:yes gene_type:complete
MKKGAVAFAKRVLYRVATVGGGGQRHTPIFTTTFFVDISLL